MAVIWSLIIIGTAINVYRLETYERYRYSDAEYVVRDVIGKHYASIYERMLNLTTRGVNEEGYYKYKELIAIKDYVGAAGQYNMYLKNDMPEKAAYYKEKMDEARKGLGKLDFTSSEIDEMFD